ncbi:MAG: methionyl-tRNA formyltransferase [Rhodothermales bacterium]|nr:methionyl-tRNA formyltransferase [Rhodothermales bacterium]
MSLRIIFMGTPDFAVPSLERLVEEGFRPIAVATVPDKPRGRGRKLRPSAVKEAALRFGIDTILQPESVKDPSFAEEVAELTPDVIVVVAFKILPPAVYESARLGAFNLHGSLLPRYRGAAPIHHAVLNGDEVTGVTTFFLKPVVDTGDMILQRSMSIGPNETTGDVHDRMMTLGAEAVVDTIRLIDSGEVPSLPQDNSLATPAPKVFREDAEIDWAKPCGEVHNRIRGMSPIPGAFTYHEEHVLKVLRSRISTGEGSPGRVLAADDSLIVACADGAVEIVEAQLEGRRRMSAEELLRGYDMRSGQILAGRADS